MDVHTPTSLFFLNFALYMFKYNLLSSIFIYILEKESVNQNMIECQRSQLEHMSPI